MVEWMNDDALDGAVDFFGAQVWRFEGPKGQDGLIREECGHWRMFKEPINLRWPFEPIALEAGGVPYDHWKFFHDLIKIYEGAVKELEGTWVTMNGKPPLDKNQHHCQYAHSEEQRGAMEYFGCRGAVKKNRRSQVQEVWEDRPELAAEELIEIGSTSVIKLPPQDYETMTHHEQRKAIVLNFPRFLCFLVKHGGTFSMQAAMSWWLSAPTVCLQKARQGHGMGKAQYQYPEGCLLPGHVKGSAIGDTGRQQHQHVRQQGQVKPRPISARASSSKAGEQSQAGGGESQ